MRAWIETPLQAYLLNYSLVARRVRAWIETFEGLKKHGIEASHAVCMRGLKRKSSQVLTRPAASHAVCVRGLKRRYPLSRPNNGSSHAVCVRGLKHQQDIWI